MRDLSSKQTTMNNQNQTQEDSNQDNHQAVQQILKELNERYSQRVLLELKQELPGKNFTSQQITLLEDLAAILCKELKEINHPKASFYFDLLIYLKKLDTPPTPTKPANIDQDATKRYRCRCINGHRPSCSTP